MVIKWWLLLLCAVCSGWAAAETHLSVSLDKKLSVLGEPLLLELKVQDVREPLSSISLDKLKQDFNVFSIASNVQKLRKNGTTVNNETMSLTLYPLRSGRLIVPAFVYRGSRSQPVPLSISEGGRSTAKVMFKTAIDTVRPLVRQAATLSLDIYDDGSLQWTAPRELRVNGAHLRSLSESQREETMDGKRYTVRRYAWALMPLREGRLTVEFPLLDALKFGTRLRYPVAALKFDAAAVPAYLPVHVPIGQLVVSAEPLPQEIAINRPVNWSFTVQGYGISEEGLGKLLSALQGNEALRFYPAVIGPLDGERAVTAVQKIRVTLPLIALKTGLLQLPEISLPYYDPASARIESASLELEKVDVFSPVWRSTQKILLGIFLLVTLAAVGYGSYIKLQRHLLRRRLLGAIRCAKNSDGLYDALLKFAGVDKQQRTLQQWLQHMQELYNVDARLAVLVRKLEAVKYADQKINVEPSKIAHEAAELLKLCRLHPKGHKRSAHQRT